MRDAMIVAEQYLALWNETDEMGRQALLAKTWQADATYVDPLMQGTGHNAISALVAGVHSKFPGFRFTLTKAAESVGTHVRFSWGLGPAGGEPIAKGTDFVLQEGDRIKCVVGFLDQVPAQAT
jgi:hypothetical protein